MRPDTEAAQNRERRQWAERLIVPLLATGVVATIFWFGAVAAAGWWLVHKILAQVGLT
jgi:hypothetical protein